MRNTIIRWSLKCKVVLSIRINDACSLRQNSIKVSYITFWVYLKAKEHANLFLKYAIKMSYF